jgi:hypothetical protein
MKQNQEKLEKVIFIFGNKFIKRGWRNFLGRFIAKTPYRHSLFVIL